MLQIFVKKFPSYAPSKEMPEHHLESAYFFQSWSLDKSLLKYDRHFMCRKIPLSIVKTFASQKQEDLIQKWRISRQSASSAKTTLLHFELDFFPLLVRSAFGAFTWYMNGRQQCFAIVCFQSETQWATFYGKFVFICGPQVSKLTYSKLENRFILELSTQNYSKSWYSQNNSIEYSHWKITCRAVVNCRATMISTFRLAIFLGEVLEIDLLLDIFVKLLAA